MAILGCVGWTLEALAVLLLLRPALGLAGASWLAVGIGLGTAGAAPWVPLETHLSAALVLWGLVACVRARFDGAAALLAIAGLMRPDTYLASALAAVWAASGGWRRLVRPAFLFVALSAPWYVFAALYYRSLVPTTLAAKKGLTPVGEYLLDSAHLTATTLLPLVPTWLAHALVWPLVGAGAVWLLRRSRAARLLLPWGAAHLLVYALVLRPPTWSAWHLQPWLLAAAVCALAGAWAAIAAARRPALRLATSIPLTLLLASHLLSFGLQSQDLPVAHAWGARDRVYRNVAQHLASVVGPGDRLSSEEVGTLAYYSDLPICDTASLVTVDLHGCLEGGRTSG
jgi:hypothetical protein